LFFSISCWFLSMVIHSSTSLVCLCISAMEEHMPAPFVFLETKKKTFCD
jgi:hypothetical protein